MIYAVIDTNVFVSALFSKNINVATVKVLDAIFQGKIVPLYNDGSLQNMKRCFIVRNSILRHLWSISI